MPNPNPLAGTQHTIHGTPAADTIVFTAAHTTVNAGEGANTITGTSGHNLINSGAGVDTIAVTSGDNTIQAGAGANTITATTGDNAITTGDGADTITVTSGDNTILAGDGANTIVATSGVNTITTGSGADTITTGGVAGGGNTINAGDGANTITTGAGDDTITGGNGADTITTGAGNDVVDAGDGANTVTTGAGNDTVYSGVDTDTITTGAGDDEIHIQGGTDTIAAGAGNDTLIADFSLATGAVSINTLAGTAAAGYAGNISGLGIATFAGVENFEITSGNFNDTITTGDGNDVVHAGGGSDIVNLAGGDDEAIYTMGANVGASDVYKGGDGVDTLTLEFTEDEWLNGQFVQTDIANYLEFQEANTGGANSALFQFTAFDLSVSEFEALNVIVDGVALDPTNDAPIAVDDTLNGPPSVLFIDDDRGLNGEGTWITTMTDLGYSVDYEAISSNGDPTSDLSSYDLVIWSNGDQDTTNLTTENITSLSSYLDQGGNLLYAGGHNLYNEPNAASFASNYLGVANYTYNMPYINSGSTATGVGGNYTLNPWSGGSYGGTMISAFTATTATSLMELNGWNASQNDIAAINQTGIFSAATFGFDINQLGVAFQADFLAATLAPIGLTGSLTDEDTAITIPSADILGNDTDIDGDVLVIAAVEATSVAGAAVTLNGDGSVFYDPAVSAILDVLAEGEAYVDTFSYTVSDGKGGIDTATVSVTLTGINDGPPAGIHDLNDQSDSYVGTNGLVDTFIFDIDVGTTDGVNSLISITNFEMGVDRLVFQSENPVTSSSFDHRYSDGLGHENLFGDDFNLMHPVAGHQRNAGVQPNNGDNEFSIYGVPGTVDSIEINTFASDVAIALGAWGPDTPHYTNGNAISTIGRAYNAASDENIDLYLGAEVAGINPLWYDGDIFSF